ncbi:hypothetical protein GE21DRAFT_1344125, partial [Neurospora crassa]
SVVLKSEPVLWNAGRIVLTSTVEPSLTGRDICTRVCCFLCLLSGARSGIWLCQLTEFLRYLASPLIPLGLEPKMSLSTILSIQTRFTFASSTSH